MSEKINNWIKKHGLDRTLAAFPGPIYLYILFPLAISFYYFLMWLFKQF